jgi:CMP-N-acetylneuraminic acid synthetase
LGSSTLVGLALSTAASLGGEVVLSTDYASHQIERDENVIFLTRMPRLATSEASMWDVLADIGKTLHWSRSDLIVLLQPTSLHEDRAGIVKLMLRENLVPSCTVERYPDRWHPWYACAPGCHNYPPRLRQGLPPRFRPNGLAYVMTGDVALTGAFWEACPKLYEVPGVTNIDTPEDWAEAVRLYG